MSATSEKREQDAGDARDGRKSNIHCLRVPPSGFVVLVYSISLRQPNANVRKAAEDFLLGFSPLAFGTPVSSTRQWR